MKKIIITAAIVLSTGLISTFFNKPVNIKPEAYYTVIGMSDRKELGSAD